MRPYVNFDKKFLDDKKIWSNNESDTICVERKITFKAILFTVL